MADAAAEHGSGRTSDGSGPGGWSGRVALAEEVVPLVGRLHREHGVVVTVHGRSLVNESVVGIVKAHRYARRVDDAEFGLDRTLALLRVLGRLDLGPATVDVARLDAVCSTGPAGGAGLHDRVADVLAPVVGGGGATAAPTDVVLYGFGRIGRLLARILLERASEGHGLRLRAVVVRRGSANDLVKRASLLRRDSVHGAFAGTIGVDEEHGALLVNGTRVQVLYSDDPAGVDYAAHGIRDALVIDNTGRWRDAAGLGQHLLSRGVSRVLLTAPGTGSVPNVVHGLNHGTLTPADRIASAASCTTNAVAPVLKALDDRYGIEHGHVETVHSFTNDQNLIDNFHAGDRRGRSAVLNMVLTETGAAQAVAKALPRLAGRLTGSSIRVPTPDVSLAILHLTLSEAVDKASLNEHLRAASLHSALHEQIGYVESPEVVSSDFVGTRTTGVVDGLATIAGGTAHVVVYVWYDNEHGYSEQVLRVAESMAGAVRPTFPAPPAGSGTPADAAREPVPV